MTMPRTCGQGGLTFFAGAAMALDKIEIVSLDL